MLTVDEGSKQSAADPIPEDKAARQARVLAEAMAEKTKRLQEEIAKHDEVINELSAENEAAGREISVRLAEMNGTIEKHGEEFEIFENSIQAQKDKIAEAEEQIAKAQAAIRTYYTAIDKFLEYQKDSVKSSLRLSEERDALAAQLDVIGERRVPLIASHQKKREKVQRRLALHLARYPETKPKES